MATFTYNSFTAKQGVLVENGGGWTCTGFDAPCSQDLSGDNYGPIIGTAAAGTLGSDGTATEMYLDAKIDLADNEFVGATSMSYTLKWHAVASFQGGNPSEIIFWTYIGSIDRFTGSIPYTADGTSVTHNNGFGYRPTSISMRTLATITDFGGASVTIAYSGISFEIHDVVYGAMSTTATSGTSSVAGSSVSSLSSSTVIPTTNDTTFLSSSTSFTTTISGQATIIRTMASQSIPVSESQSHLPPSRGSPSSSSMTPTELASVIAGSLIGVGLVLLAITFWYQWQRRRRMVSSGNTSRGDGQSQKDTDSRMGNQEPWVPRPYRKRPYSRPTTENADATPVEEEWAEPTQPEEQGRSTPSWQGDSIASLLPSPPPPAYSQITPRPGTRSIAPSVAIENA